MAHASASLRRSLGRPIASKSALRRSAEELDHDKAEDLGNCAQTQSEALSTSAGRRRERPRAGRTIRYPAATSSRMSSIPSVHSSCAQVPRSVVPGVRQLQHGAKTATPPGRRGAISPIPEQLNESNVVSGDRRRLEQTRIPGPLERSLGAGLDVAINGDDIAALVLLKQTSRLGSPALYVCNLIGRPGLGIAKVEGTWGLVPLAVGRNNC